MIEPGMSLRFPGRYQPTYEELKPDSTMSKAPLRNCYQPTYEELKPGPGGIQLRG